MPLGGRKKKKGAPPMLDTTPSGFNAAQSFAVGHGGSDLTLGQGAASKTGGKEIKFTATGITYDNEEKQLSESHFEPWDPTQKTFLGKGAAGMVYLMRKKDSGEPVAVKHMSMSDKSDRDQTIEEVRSMWKLSHTNVVRFYGAYWRQQDQTVCFVLEYMNSNSLQHILRASHGTPMAEPVVGRVLGGVLAGVEYLHSQQIIHRDLKPGNVLVHDTGEDVVVKVADFGIVKTMESKKFSTTGVGTVAYMSPERLEINHDVGYDYATDLWAVGLIAGECATGAHLYPREVSPAAPSHAPTALRVSQSGAGPSCLRVDCD
jgi:serine/threonine protein kinase|eukprot:COSAG01_NODE_6045_length_3881_cov_13.963511_1_plen_317_part_00